MKNPSEKLKIIAQNNHKIIKIYYYKLLGQNQREI